MLRALFYTILILGFAGTVYAKSGKPKPPGRVIEMGELVVKGRVQKPRVMYILDKGKIDYQGIPLKEDFLKKVEVPIKEDWF